MRRAVWSRLVFLSIPIQVVFAMSAMQEARRVAFVTGGNKGIGFCIAQGLAVDFTVVIGSRDMGRGEAAVASLRNLGFDDVHVERVDLEEEASWTECAENIRLKHGRLDVLCNNAAICFNDPTLFGKVPHTPFEGQADITVRTNFFGTLGVTRALLPLLRESPSPRVINIASAAGRLSILRSPEKRAVVSSPDLRLEDLETLMNTFIDDVRARRHAAEGWPNTCYGMSKVGIIAMTRVFARLEPRVMFNSVDPGFCATDQNMNRGTLPAATGAQAPIALASIDDFQSGAFFSYTGTEVEWLKT